MEPIYLLLFSYILFQKSKNKFLYFYAPNEF